MRARITYTTDGDPITVTTTLANIVAWERRYKRKASDMAGGVAVEDIAYLAWEASKSAKIVVPAVFDDFVAKLTDIAVEAEEAAHPTQAAPGAEH